MSPELSKDRMSGFGSSLSLVATNRDIRLRVTLGDHSLICPQESLHTLCGMPPTHFLTWEPQLRISRSKLAQKLLGHMTHSYNRTFGCKSERVNPWK